MICNWVSGDAQITSRFLKSDIVHPVQLVCLRGPDPERERVLGLHMTGPNAGEMMQGFAVAIGYVGR